YDRTDGTEVNCGGRLRIKIWGLEKSRRKVDRVLQRQIDSVHRLWRHRPLRAIYFCAQPCEFAMIREETTPPKIPKDIIRFDLITRIVMPIFGIAYAYV